MDFMDHYGLAIFGNYLISLLNHPNYGCMEVLGVFFVFYIFVYFHFSAFSSLFSAFSFYGYSPRFLIYIKIIYNKRL